MRTISPRRAGAGAAWTVPAVVVGRPAVAVAGTYRAQGLVPDPAVPSVTATAGRDPLASRPAAPTLGG